jgi:hypothetical protein
MTVPAKPLTLSPSAEILRTELMTYLRELPRLLEEGHEGRFVLIKGDQVVSIWDTSDDVYQAGRERFGLQPFLGQPIEARDLERPWPEDLLPRKAV